MFFCYYIINISITIIFIILVRNLVCGGMGTPLIVMDIPS